METRIRFEANGDSRKEVHTRVRINSELGVRQFSHLNFDFNRSYEQIEIPLVHITHASGGTADILPSAITDQPNPGVADAPAYRDVRLKSVRILGLSPGDELEYRVVTTAAQGPFTPNFYFSHDFGSDSVVTRELFEIDLPASRDVKPWTSQSAQHFETEKSGEGMNARVVYRWQRPAPHRDAQDAPVEIPLFFVDSDVVLTTFRDWVSVLKALQEPFGATSEPTPDVRGKASDLARNATSPEEKLRALYDFVSQKITTVALPIGATAFHLRPPAAVLASGYATPEEKCTLLTALAKSIALDAKVYLVVPGARSERGPAIPTIFTTVLVVARTPTRAFWLDPSTEVAPFGMIAASIRGKSSLPLSPASDTRLFENVPENLPFASTQRVHVDASLAADGTLNAKVKYSMRGDNELLLRVAFHQSPRDKWKEVAQLLALSDGFRGKIYLPSASEPVSTETTLHRRIRNHPTQVRRLVEETSPHPCAASSTRRSRTTRKRNTDAAASPIDLGTPLEVDTRVVLHLPPGTSAEVPTGTVVDRDYATFVSRYNTQSAVITACRHINFLHRQVPADHSADYAAFLHAVQTDQSQHFVLIRSDVQASSAKLEPKDPLQGPRQNLDQPASKLHR